MATWIWTPARRFEISEYLRVCESYQSRFESEKDMDGWMRDRLRDVQMPASLWSEIQTDVKGGLGGEGRPKRLRIADWFKPLVLAASVVFMVSAGIFLWERFSDSPELVVAVRSSMVEFGAIHAPLTCDIKVNLRLSRQVTRQRASIQPIQFNFWL